MKVACPRCGSNIIFVPSSQNCFCAHCHSNISLDEVLKNSFDSQTSAYYEECTCSSCGARLLVNEYTTISKCLYCGSTQIVKNRFQGEFAPDGIIPFQIDFNTFVEKYDRYICRKLFVPKDFKRRYELTDIKGMYLPVYTYEYHVATDSYGRTYNVSDDGNPYCYYAMKAKFNMEITIDGIEEIRDDLINQIKPFDYSKIKPFHPVYLCGFSASNPNERMNTQKEKIKSIRRQYIQDNIICGLTHSFSMDRGKIHAQYQLLSKKYVMVPIWIFNTKYHNKKYTFVVNGQTGNVGGDVPYNVIPALKIVCIGIFILIFLYDYTSIGKDLFWPFIIWKSLLGLICFRFV